MKILKFVLRGLMCCTIIMNIMIIVMIVGKPIFVIQKVNKCNLTISNVPVKYTTYLVPKNQNNLFSYEIFVTFHHFEWYRLLFRNIQIKIKFGNSYFEIYKTF